MHSQWKCKSRSTPQGRTQGTEGQKQPVVADIINVHSNEAEQEAITLESKRERKWGENGPMRQKLSITEIYKTPKTSTIGRSNIIPHHPNRRRNKTKISQHWGKRT